MRKNSFQNTYNSVTTRDGGKFLIAKRIFAIVLIPSTEKNYSTHVIYYILPSHTFIHSGISNSYSLISSNLRLQKYQNYISLEQCIFKKIFLSHLLVRATQRFIST